MPGESKTACKDLNQQCGWLLVVLDYSGRGESIRPARKLYKSPISVDHYQSKKNEQMMNENNCSDITETDLKMIHVGKIIIYSTNNSNDVYLYCYVPCKLGQKLCLLKFIQLDYQKKTIHFSTLCLSYRALAIKKETTSCRIY